MSNVIYPKSCAPSAIMLSAALTTRGYSGPPINWGTGAHIVNKLDARIKFRDNEVSSPRIWVGNENQFLKEGTVVVGRRSVHRKGRGFFIIPDEDSYRRVLRFKNPPSHFIELLKVEREFRVHIVNGSSIKMAEKVGGDGIVRTFEHGWRFQYPHSLSSSDRRNLRELARSAVAALGYPFGAVDVLQSEGVFYVSEVNAAPSLTSASDTLDRYVDAFMKEYYEQDSYPSGEGDSDYSERRGGYDAYPYIPAFNYHEAF